nr:hypothetical protein Iba_chr01bCG19700 [Ipomoea batatas]GMC52569.1 hypothetical protein Iba_chr01cCG16440 [Ipomoea batatas]GMC54569.1 hypothetical protein Iba_chr01dCG17340 [Ipomoea batatas]GMC56402.1 hypothetical protein Iba_chr01fCG6730 [Ipomoea batatas]
MFSPRLMVTHYLYLWWMDGMLRIQRNCLKRWKRLLIEGRAHCLYLPALNHLLRKLFVLKQNLETGKSIEDC